MKMNIIKISLLALVASQVVMGGAAIDFPNSTLIRRLKTSFDAPVDLYQTNNGTGLAHDDKFFTARTLLRLGPEIAAYEQKALRNEICASYNIYSNNTAAVGGVNAPTNRTLTIGWLPGSLGVYVNGNNIQSIADHGLAGERLDSVLRKLANETDAVKIFAAKYYAVAMAKNLEIIHRADIIWNNAHLRNFYVRPEGTLYASDFSEAEKPDAGTLAARKSGEWKDFVVNTVAHMYSLLFPAATAKAEYDALVTAGGVGAAAVRTHAWSQADFIAALDALILGGHDLTPNVPMAGGLQDAGTGAGVAAGGFMNVAPAAPGNDNATKFLVRANNIPYKPNVGLINSIARADHDSTQNNPGAAAFLGDRGFALEDAVRLLIDSGNGTPYSRLDAALVGPDATSMCLTWTGK